MWVLLSRHLRTWAIFAIAVPLLSRVLGALGRALERRRGPSALTRVLTWAQRLLARRARGPLATGTTPPGTGDRTHGTTHRRRTDPQGSRSCGRSPRHSTERSTPHGGQPAQS